MNKLRINSHQTLLNRFVRLTQLVVVGLSVAGMSACSHNQQPGGSGPQKRMKLSVGDINEISLTSPADSAVLLTGTSDNNEVVDVSQKPEAATQTNPVRTTSSGQLIFLIKGVTVGTARVVFSEKRTGETGDGRVRRTYVVQVVSK